MVFAIFPYIIALLMLLGGHQGHVDLLESISPETYWRIKSVVPDAAQLIRDAGPDAPVGNIDKLVKDLQAEEFATRDKAKKELERMGPAIIDLLKPATESKEPEVAAVTAELVKNFSEHRQERAIRRLMAVRTLGDRKEQSALPALKGLIDAKELFLAEYARRAIAQIEGNALPAVDQAKAFAGDVELLPRETQLVFQNRAMGDEVVTIDSLAEKVSDSSKRPLAADRFDLPPGGFDKALLAAAASRKVLEIIERTGNIEFDGVTVGLAYTEENVGFVAVIVRGKYDALLIHQIFKEMNFGTDLPVEKPGDIPMIASNDGQNITFFPNNEVMTFVTVMDAKDKLNSLKSIEAALKSGKGTFAENKDLAPLLAAVDRSGPVWGIMKISEALKKEPVFFTCFETLVLQSKSGKEGLNFSIKGDGAEPDKAKLAAEGLNNDLAGLIPMVQQEVAMAPELKSVIDTLQSMKAVADGKSATFSGQIKKGLIDALAAAIGPSLARELIQPPPRQADIQPVERIRERPDVVKVDVLPDPTAIPK